MLKPAHIISEGSYLATIELWRRPDGVIAAVLRDMPAHVIEHHGETPAQRLELLARWLETGADFLRGEAFKMEP